ncbi:MULTISPECIES: peptidoglycan DD-metalloendopeptidase family protein [Aequorivita]|uniref:Peptidoglycan DD-metalloendopeptidase family protein n=1 Tax=Aequorivita iocasae TaxID=2803865 RepID=A0ABX7DTH9_9FLAO|nr:MULTISPECIES: peptidoglycan DD-metalloendopeptidase family protein [Aequorivita]QQX77445.1 peptidoglycan DD-metalloendopeptidase family protein [Aequorivita iocasae]UCA56936.1 peptidoglycan DD-metalloendopeptidase family protein [Aequorivita sp. F7]
MKTIILATLTLILLTTACDNQKNDLAKAPPVVEEAIIEQYGYILNDFEVVRDTIRKGDTFGDILFANGVPQEKIMEVATKFRDSFDVRKIVVGKPYLLLKSKDSLNTTHVFIYETNQIDYAVVDFRDTLSIYNSQKPVRYEEREASGIITSSLSATMEEQNLSPYMTDQLANIYAWTINFFKLQPGDRFKVIYTEKFIDDTIPAGLKEIKAAYFEHNGKPLYAFKFNTDATGKVFGYYDELANNLKRAFLKAPVKFSRISSRYNLNRRIKYYGFKLRPHRGTDFAAPIGTPILATADGIVTKSERRGGNGNYVKIRHNGTYETQYLHMKARNVKVGQHVSQGDVIGWIGMTGNTSGPHVCYRFWKNGKEVDPFKEETPFSQPLPKDLHEQYFANLLPLKEKLDCIVF